MKLTHWLSLALVLPTCHTNEPSVKIVKRASVKASVKASEKASVAGFRCVTWGKMRENAAWSVSGERNEKSQDCIFIQVHKRIWGSQRWPCVSESCAYGISFFFNLTEKAAHYTYTHLWDFVFLHFDVHYFRRHLQQWPLSTWALLLGFNLWVS